MLEHIARRWIEELRSDRHQQAKGTMKDCNGGLCCLGVLQQEILGIAIPIGQSVLTTEAMATADMKSQIGGDYNFQCNVAHLPGLNDGNTKWGIKPKTFSQIADIIEANWKDL